jgi:hypothetical protein
MKPRTLAAFRLGVAVSNRDRDWERIAAWNRAGLLRLTPNPDAKGHATAMLTDAGVLEADRQVRR